MSSKLVERTFWWLGWAYDFSKYATIILLLGLVTHYFFFTLLIVRGESMVPNYTDGQVLAVNKIDYIIGRPQRGDVVAMYFPGETQKHFIKRVVGLPSETIKIEDGRVYINNRLFDESYLDSSLMTIPDLERTLQTNEYFMMGDNRTVSSDSRAWGAVPRSFIIGKAVGGQILRLSPSPS